MIKPYFKLYTNELKRSKILFVLLLIANQILLDFYRSFIPGISSFSIAEFPLFTLLFVLPLFLFYSFTIERRINTNYILFPLPVNRSAIIISKYLVLLSMAVFFTIGHFIFNVVSITSNYDFQHALNFIFDYRPLHIISPIFLYAGILCTAESFQYITKLYKAVFVFIFLTASYLSTLWLAKIIRAIRGDFMIFKSTEIALDVYRNALRGYETLNMMIFNGYLNCYGIGFFNIRNLSV